MKSLLVILLIPVAAAAQKIPFRQYRAGKTTVYTLTSESYNNNKFSGKSISRAKLTVIKDTAGFAEAIQWLGKTHFSSKDTVNLDSTAQKIKPYTISLSPGKKVLLPRLDNAEMVGDITDLNTFFVAVSPALNMQKLSAANPVFTNEKYAEGNFADGVKIIKGSDCIRVTQTLVKISKKYTVIKTDFLPPVTSCLTPLLDTISKKTFEHPNNFQMVQQSAGGKVNLLWGNESFTITSTIDNKDGKLLEATMTNTLQLRMRINAAPDLQTYDFELPYTISRNLKLELTAVKK